MSWQSQRGRRSYQVVPVGGIALGLALLLLGCAAGGSSSLEAQGTAAVANAAPAKGEPQHLPVEAEVTLAGRRFELEVARTPEQQRLGLMFRTDLPPNRGMWFPFDPPQPAAFWMFNTPLNLDIIFLHQGRVVYIAANVPRLSRPALPHLWASPQPASGQRAGVPWRDGSGLGLASWRYG
jgi:uncharacterized membrane protein (UPF0127 family)